MANSRTDYSDFPDDCCRLILIGKTGNGKSATGNMIIGKEVFLSKRGINSETKRTNFHYIRRNNLTIQVTDTPGLADTDEQDVELTNRMKESMYSTYPGPHALLLVLSCNKRFTSEEYQIRRCAKLNTVLNEANWRYVLFDNKADENEKRGQVDELLGKVKSLVVTNQSSYFRHNFSDHLCDSFDEMVNDEIKLLRKKMLIGSSDASNDTTQEICDSTDQSKAPQNVGEFQETQEGGSVTLRAKQTQETNESNKQPRVGDVDHQFNQPKLTRLPKRCYSGPRTRKIYSGVGNTNALESESDKRKCENLSNVNEPTEQVSVEVDNRIHRQSQIDIKDKIVNQPEKMTETQRHEYRRSLSELPDKVKEGFEKENVKDIEQCTVM